MGAFKAYKRRKRRTLVEDPNNYTPIMQRLMKSKEIDFTGFLSGVDIYMIDELEVRNSISTNVFEFGDDTPSPIRLTECSFPRHLGLLFIRYSDRGIQTELLSLESLDKENLNDINIVSSQVSH